MPLSQAVQVTFLGTGDLNLAPTVGEVQQSSRKWSGLQSPTWQPSLLLPQRAAATESLKEKCAEKLVTPWQRGGQCSLSPALSAFLTHKSALSFRHRRERVELLQYVDLLMATEDLWLEHSAQWLEHVNDHHMTSVGARELELHFISDTNNNVLGQASIM